MIIQVAETHPPKTGKKLGTIKTASGESFGIWPDKLAALQVGGRYQIEFDENEFNGRTSLQLNLKDIKAAGIPD